MIDLHTHTSWSDGALSVSELLELANQSGIEVLSITDHDNIRAYEEVKELRGKFNGKIIPGVELTFLYNGTIMEMLGYGIDLDILEKEKVIMENLVHSTVEKELKHLNYFKSICDRLGIIYSENLSVVRPNDMADAVMADDILRYEENKKILDDLGIINRTTFYRNHVNNASSPFYIDNTKGKLDIFGVTDIIHKAGGKCFLAHPLIYGIDDIIGFLDYVVSLNIVDGIECYQRKHSKEQIEFLESYCDKHGLLKSGGSDLHIIEQVIGHAAQGIMVIEKNIASDWLEGVVFL